MLHRIVFVFVFVFVFVNSFAAPARQVATTITQPDGTTLSLIPHGDEFFHYYTSPSGQFMTPDSLGFWHPGSDPSECARRDSTWGLTPQRGPSHLSPLSRRGAGGAALPARGLVILASFSDTLFSPADSLPAMDSMLNAVSYTHQGATGSARAYFQAQSQGLYNPHFDVVGPVTLSRPCSYYGTDRGSQGNDQYAGNMVVEACILADSLWGVNFSDYDANHDGKVDFVFILFAGKGQADGGAPITIWPHQWTIPSARSAGTCTYTAAQCTLDGVSLNAYACSGEINGATSLRCGIGTFCHEFGHVLGMVDYYDTGYGYNWDYWVTPSYWSIMDQGCYTNEGLTPPNYSLFDRCYMGWDTAQVLLPGKTDLTLLPLGQEGGGGYILNATQTYQSPTTAGVCYYIENRQLTGWDAYLPGHGMVVWKVDYSSSVWSSNKPNNTKLSPRCAVVSASGEMTNIGRLDDVEYGHRDPFPGILEVTSFTPIPTCPILDIREVGADPSECAQRDSTWGPTPHLSSCMVHSEPCIHFSTTDVPSDTQDPSSCMVHCEPCTDQTSLVYYHGQLCLLTPDGHLFTLLGQPVQ